MAQLTITIPDADLNRILDAFANQFNYNSATDGTKAQFARTQVIRFIRTTVKDSEGKAAKAAVDSGVDAIGLT